MASDRPIVAGKIPRMAARIRGWLRMAENPAVIRTVAIALGASSPARAAIRPGQPRRRFPIRMVSLIRLMPGDTWASAQARVNASSSIQPRARLVWRTR